MDLESLSQPGRGLREYFRGTGNALVTLSCPNSSVCPPPEDFFELLSDYAVVRMHPIAG